MYGEFPPFRLQEVINIERLQAIQDKFAESLGLAAVIIDNAGNQVTSVSNSCQLCQIIRSSRKGYLQCLKSDSFVSSKAMHKEKQVVHRCHAGLLDASAPIIVNGQYMGAILCGQAVLEEGEKNDEATLRERIGHLDLDFSEAFSAFQKVRVVSKEKINAAAELLYLMASYITEIGVKSVVEKQFILQTNKMREMELKLLENQLNPHFLFNALNTIARLALIEGADQTQSVAYALAELLRNNLKPSGRMVRLEEELRQVKNYLLIQQTRFGDRLYVNWFLDPKTMDYMIPLLTIQTLVENAIVHGLEPREEQTRISIRSYLEKMEAVVEVADDGCGINAATLKGLLNIEKAKSAGGPKLQGLGLHHVQTRLHYYFGPEYGITIQSEPGQGTRVLVRLPRFSNNRNDTPSRLHMAEQIF